MNSLSFKYSGNASYFTNPLWNLLAFCSDRSIFIVDSMFSVSDQIPLGLNSIATDKIHHRPSLLFGARRPYRLVPRALLRNKVHGPYNGLNPLIVSSRPRRIYYNSSIASCTISTTAGQSDDPNRLNVDHAIGEIRKVWESLPQPVRSFPWVKVLENFLELTFRLVYVVSKYLSVLLLAVSSLSEMSYCAHEGKMLLIPIPVLAGVAVAGALRDTILDLYPRLKETQYPLHLAVIASFFILVKLPGPSYPYLGRILIPHFANGGLWRTLWFAFLWYRRPREASTVDHQLDQEL